MKKKVAFYTLGCKLNFTETSTISRQFNPNNFEIVDFNTIADIYIINTCTVTAKADKKSLQIIKKAKILAPNSVVVAIGCLSELKKQELEHIKEIDLVLGNNEKFNIINHLNNKNAIEYPNENLFYSSFSLNERTRSFLKVQDGCDYKCSYCTIPMARGKGRSDTIKNVIKNIDIIASKGIKEVVLTGINIGIFGKENAESFIELLQNIENHKNSIDRFRISSIEPDLLTNEIIEFIGNSNKFAPHFHIPLQSASNQVLKDMQRRYKRELFEEKVNYIISQNEFATIGTDIIVGFPTETEELFNQTIDFIENIPLSYIHIFNYSQRNNTIASTLPDNTAVIEKKNRSKILQNISNEKRNEFYKKNIGRDLEVLFEEENHAGMMLGYSENYIKVKINYNKEFANKIIPITLTEQNIDYTAEEAAKLKIKYANTI